MVVVVVGGSGGSSSSRVVVGDGGGGSRDDDDQARTQNFSFGRWCGLLITISQPYGPVPLQDLRPNS